MQHTSTSQAEKEAHASPSVMLTNCNTTVTAWLDYEQQKTKSHAIEGMS